MEIYLDNSATTQVSPSVAELMLHTLTENYGNPSSLHHKGFMAEQAISAARAQLAAVLGVRSDEMIFTSCGSEANNLALLGACHALRRRGNALVTTGTEHSSLLGAADALEQEGFRVTRVLPRSDGTVSPEEIARQVDDTTLLVSVMQVNSETGSINDLAAIAAAVKQRNPNTLLHSDCVQSFCRLPITPQRWGLDLVTVSGHKIHGPKGVAALYRRKGVRLLPLYYGSSQESGLHSGTENTPAICGMGLAAEELWGARAENSLILQRLHDHLLGKVKILEGVCINSPSLGAPYIVNLSVPGIRSEVMIHYLEQFGIYISSGSACSKGAKSHVLAAMGLSPERLDSALRVSFCRNNTIEQVDEFVARLQQGMSQLARK